MKCISTFYDSYFAAEEAANEGACIECAVVSGYTVELSQECDSMDRKCVNCPFYTKEEQSKDGNQWVLFTRRTDYPKLGWLMTKLQQALIPHQLNGNSRHAPRLEVRKDQLDAAWNILDRVDGIPDDDSQFLPPHGCMAKHIEK